MCAFRWVSSRPARRYGPTGPSTGRQAAGTAADRARLPGRAGRARVPVARPWRHGLGGAGIAVPGRDPHRPRGIRRDRPVPVVLSPVHECAGAVHVGGAVRGCTVRLAVSGRDLEYDAIAGSFWAILPERAMARDRFAAASVLQRLGRTAPRSPSAPTWPSNRNADGDGLAGCRVMDWAGVVTDVCFAVGTNDSTRCRRTRGRSTARLRWMP